jgi:hypothetical protein
MGLSITVIASEAKQSIARRTTLWIASSLALLAMTAKGQRGFKPPPPHR